MEKIGWEDAGSPQPSSTPFFALQGPEAGAGPEKASQKEGTAELGREMKEGEQIVDLKYAIVVNIQMRGDYQYL